jgi:hypothetical protein
VARIRHSHSRRMSGLRALSGSRQSSHFRLTTDHSGTGQIALGEFPTELANVDGKPDQRAPLAASGSPETPGNPATIAPVRHCRFGRRGSRGLSSFTEWILSDADLSGRAAGGYSEVIA